MYSYYNVNTKAVTQRSSIFQGVSKIIGNDNP